MIPYILLVFLWLRTGDCSSVRRHPGRQEIYGVRAPEESFFSYDPKSPHGPSNWPGQCRTGNLQSPVHILTSLVQYKYPFHPPVYVWYKLFQAFAVGEFENNGHTATFTTVDNGNTNDFGKVLRNVPNFEKTDYVFYETHFHIGGIARHPKRRGLLPPGSEHVVNGRSYAGEIHIVHWKRDSKTKTFEEAASAPNGLVAIGVFFNVVDDCDGEADRLISHYVSHIQRVGHRISAAVNPSLILPKDGKFYTYRGSKTTPPCNENVIWIVYKTPINISKKSYKILMSLETGERNMPALIKFGNNRPIQRQIVPGLNANFHPWGQDHLLHKS